jgi:DNA-binding transcriptional regulator LsrR (DeoR family)
MMNDKTHLMMKIAKLYYESGLTQDTISRQLRISRPTISRLMQDAIDQGIVKITITQDTEGYTDLERKLSEIYDLHEVIVADVKTEQDASSVTKDLGITAANYFNRIVRDGDSIGLTWGSTLSGMVDNIQSSQMKNVTVIQMVGGLGEPDANSHATDLVRRVSSILGATVRLMPAPGIVKNIEVAKILRSDPYIASAIVAASKVDVAFIGIGALTRNALLVRNESIITWKEIEDLISKGAVGELGLHFYDKDGNFIHSNLEDRIIGVSLDEIKALERVVAIAGGTEKYEAIRGAIHGHLVNTLITDIYTANKLLENA